MRLHLATISDSGCKYLDKEYKNPTETLSVEYIAKKKNHNIMMIDIASTLSYPEFNEIKDYKTAFDIWNKLKEIYGGDECVRRAKVEKLRGKFDQMRMREDENVARYVEIIKASVSAIRASKVNFLFVSHLISRIANTLIS